MQIQFYEEGERDDRNMSLIIHINQGVQETRRVIEKADCFMRGNSRIKVFKHEDEQFTRVVFPMDITRSTTFGGILYDLSKSEARAESHGRIEG